MARWLLVFVTASTCLLSVLSAPALAGPYTEDGHLPSAMLAWAAEVDDFVRGPLDIANPGGGNASHGQPEDALGPASGADVYDTVSLGDGGSITLFFPDGIADGPGDDFAVFENSFYSVEGLFGELAFVEVSSNGSDFARFDAISLIAAPVLGFGAFDPTDVRSLAGKQPIDRGTGFDLADLASHPLVVAQLLDLEDVAYVRIIDVVGDGSRLDSLGQPIYDPYPTAFAEGGFDLQGVGVLHAVPEPGAAASLSAGALALSFIDRSRARRRLRRNVERG